MDRGDAETMVTQKSNACIGQTDDMSVSEICQMARSIWLSPKDCDMDRVEALYIAAWRRLQIDMIHNDVITPSIKKPKYDNNQRKNDSKDGASMKYVGDKLALLLLQSGRVKEADEILQSLGYTCRLAESLLHYNTDCPITSSKLKLRDEHNTEAPCRIYLNFLSNLEEKILRDVFLNPNNSYWADHSYQVEPPSPYFSYVIPLQPSRNSSKKEDSNVKLNFHEDCGLIGCFVKRLQTFLASTWKPALTDATFCEMWAHNRPHQTGHQFHFDSDNEGIGGFIRNPICSAVVYLNGCDDLGTIGGPSVITNQRLVSKHLANKCWLCFPSMSTSPKPVVEIPAKNNDWDNRKTIICAFDGSVLHGVIPGKPRKPFNPEQRRVTLMFAFWRRIRVRTTDDDGKVIGAARLLPTEPQWARELRSAVPESTHMDVASGNVTEIDPIFVDHVYEKVGWKVWTTKMGFPEYEQIFQGF